MDTLCIERTDRSTLRPFAKAVWGVEDMGDDFATALDGISRLEQFFGSLGFPMTLSEHGIDSRNFDAMAKHAVEYEGLAYAWVPLEQKDVKAIYEMCI